MDNFSNLEIIIKIKITIRVTDENEILNVIDNLRINKGGPNRLHFWTFKLSLTITFQQKQE